MIVLFIILFILLLIIALLNVKASLIFTYREKVGINLSVLGIKYPIYPKSRKKARTSKHSREKLKKIGKRKEQAHKAKNQAAKKQSLTEALDIMGNMLLELTKKLYRRIKLKAARIIISVATDDAAKTALLFSAVNNSLGAILIYLRELDKLDRLKRSKISVKSDFLSNKTVADIELSFNLRLWHIAEILFAAALKYVTLKSKEKKQK